jgi:hypothetical protein
MTLSAIELMTCGPLSDDARGTQMTDVNFAVTISGSVRGRCRTAGLAKP